MTKLFTLLASIGALLGVTAASAQTPDPVFDEQDAYFLHWSSEFADGVQVLSHSQETLISRVRDGDISQILMDRRNGAVTIETVAGTFGETLTDLNPAEAVYGYDYAQNRLLSDDGFLDDFDTRFRPFIVQGAPRGADARWTVDVPIDVMGLPARGENVQVSISRTYASHNGQDVAVLEFAIPTFAYTDGSGAHVTQWGRGFAVTDASFGTIHALGTFHRAMVEDADGQLRPMVKKVSAFAKNIDGSWRFDFSGFDLVEEVVARVSDGDAGLIREVDLTGARPVPDHTPFDIANTLQMIAFGSGEHSANSLLGDIYTYVSSGGTEKTHVGKIAAGTAVLTTIDAYTQDFRKLSGPIQSAADIEAFRFEMATDLSNRANRAAQNYDAMAESLIGQMNDITRTQGELMQTINQVEQTSGGLLDSGRVGSALMGEYESLSRQRDFIVDRLNNLTLERFETAERFAEFTDEFGDVINAEPGLLSKMGNSVNALKSKIPPGFTDKMNSIKAGAQAFIDDIPPGAIKGGQELFEKGGAAFSWYTIGTSVNNAYQDTGPSNQIELSRAYGLGDEPSVWGGLVMAGVDYAGMKYDLAQGDVFGFARDATASLYSSVVDIYVSAEGLNSINQYNDLLDKETELLSRLAEKRRVRAILDGTYTPSEQDLDRLTFDERAAVRERNASEAADQYVSDLLYTDEDPWADGYIDNGMQDPRVDPSSGLPKPGYWAYLKENHPGTLASYGIDPDWPVGQTGPTPPDGQGPTAPVSREPTQAEWDQFHRDMAKVINDKGYPTAPPRPPQPPGPPTPIGQSSELPDWLLDEINQSIETARRQEESRLELAHIQARKLAEDLHEEAEFDALLQQRRADSGIDDMNAFFENNAFDYGVMAGTVQTDLTPWLEWLLTQDVRRLERLALQAGYPNLASALADASNIMRLSQDEGYRQWSLQAPSCAGLAGCGPSYLERWAMKRSIVALGDLLLDSRFFDSTAGLTDITISTNTLRYLLFDNALEDGDIVDVEISQFGQTRVRDRVNLTNAGRTFNVGLGRGVAQVRIQAVNEGTASPNTAQINLENVVSGPNSQSYRLTTGEVAQLRVEVGAGGN